MAKNVASTRDDCDSQEAQTGVDRTRFPEENKIRRLLTGPERVHFEGLGMAWTAVSGLPPCQRC